MESQNTDLADQGVVGYCKKCGETIGNGQSFCGSCGEPVTLKSENDDENPWAVVSYVCAALSILFFPPLFGMLGIIFGIIASKNGDKRGRQAIVISAVCMVIGIFFGIFIAIL